MPSTRNRVPGSTHADVNRRIQQHIARNVMYYGEHKDEIPQRLRELDQEWDIERAIEANAAAVGFIGVALSAVHDRRWLALPAFVTGFLFQHAVQGWCPPVPILRRLGFRTAHEIAEERQALKALRGDYQKVKANGGAHAALEAARA
jgi:hypothetical protein